MIPLRNSGDSTTACNRSYTGVDILVYGRHHGDVGEIYRLASAAGPEPWMQCLWVIRQLEHFGIVTVP